MIYKNITIGVNNSVITKVATEAPIDSRMILKLNSCRINIQIHVGVLRTTKSSPRPCSIAAIDFAVMWSVFIQHCALRARPLARMRVSTMETVSAHVSLVHVDVHVIRHCRVLGTTPHAVIPTCKTSNRSACSATWVSVIPLYGDGFSNDPPHVAFIHHQGSTR